MTYRARLACVVTALLLGNIGRVPTHTARDNANTTALLSEHPSRCAHAVVDSIKIDGSHTVPVLDVVVKAAGLGWDTGVGNHDVQTAEFRDDCSHLGFHGGMVTDVNLVCPDLDIELVRNGLGDLIRLL